MDVWLLWRTCVNNFSQELRRFFSSGFELKLEQHRSEQVGKLAAAILKSSGNL